MIEFIKDLKRYRIKLDGELIGFLHKITATRWGFMLIGVVPQTYIFPDELRQIADKLDELKGEIV